MTHVGIRGCHGEAVQDALHFGIILIHGIVDCQQAAVVLVTVRLVEDAQHHVKAVVDVSVQTWYLDDDAVVVQAFHEWVRQSLGDDVAVVVARLMIDIQHRFFDAAHLVAQKVDCHHRQCIAVLPHVLGIGVVDAQILPESQCLSL